MLRVSADTAAGVYTGLSVVHFEPGWNSSLGHTPAGPGEERLHIDKAVGGGGEEEKERRLRRKGRERDAETRSEGIK